MACPINKHLNCVGCSINTGSGGAKDCAIVVIADSLKAITKSIKGGEINAKSNN